MKQLFSVHLQRIVCQKICQSNFFFSPRSLFFTKISIDAFNMTSDITICLDIVLTPNIQLYASFIIKLNCRKLQCNWKLHKYLKTFQNIIFIGILYGIVLILLSLCFWKFPKFRRIQNIAKCRKPLVLKILDNRSSTVLYLHNQLCQILIY